MIKGTKEYLDDLVKRLRCPEHDDPLTVAWHVGENSYVVRCGHGHFPEELTPNPSLSELNRQGLLPDVPVKDNIERRERRKATLTPTTPQAVTFQGIPATDLGTGELLKLEVLQALVEYAHKYGLDPARGHVMLMYGKPYIGIDGYLFHANQEKIPYKLLSWPMTSKEKEQYQLGEYDHGWVAKVIRIDTSAEFNGVGIVTSEEMTEKSKRNPNQLAAPVVAKHPWQLAQKRAEWQALRRAVPIGESNHEVQGE